MVNMLKKISEGAEADIYITTFLGIKSIIKYRRTKKYIPKELDRWLRFNRTKIESRIMSSASLNGINVPKILFVNVDSIYIEKVNGKLLSDMDNTEIPKPVLKRIGIELAKLHNLNITHGDYTKANIIINKDNIPIIIDFGLAEHTNSIEEKALDLILLKRSLEDMFHIALDAYISTCKDSAKIVSKLKSIEKRGRYQNRSVDMADEE